MNTPDEIRLLDADPRLKRRLDGQSFDAALRILNKADRDAEIFTYDATNVPFYQYSSADGLRFTVELLRRVISQPMSELALPEKSRF